MIKTKLRRLKERCVSALLIESSNLLSIKLSKQLRENGERPMEQSFKLLTSLRHPRQGIKVCVLTESWVHSSKKKNSKTILPIVLHIYCWLKGVFVNRVRRILSIFNLSRVVGNLSFFKKKGSSIPPSAGVFHGLEHRHVLSQEAEIQNDTNFYRDISSDARSIKLELETLVRKKYRQKNRKNTVPTIGVLISCYKPDEFIDAFIENLTSLSNCESLIPVFVNAGMSESSKKKINSLKQLNIFKDIIFIDALESKIYEAWNIGIVALNGRADYITNFNVDDKRHPLCLELQSLCLQLHEDVPVCTTDYIYFFDPEHTVEETYNLNQNNNTYIPSVNKRTLFYKNFPHSSPMWRSELHLSQNCGFFDESYISAGDAEFWYRVSRRYDSTAHVLSIPLSLYYHNPNGVSTNSETTGKVEHIRCSDIHVSHLNKAIYASVTQNAIEKFDVIDPIFMQLRAAAKNTLYGVKT